MVKLNSFRNNNKQRNIIIVESIFLIGLILVGISYAVYQRVDEVRFINAKVGSFETSSSDIELAMTLDGEVIDVPPNKSSGFYNVTIECDNADGKWNMEEWGADIRNIKSNRVKCNVSFESYKKSIQDVELGDYIKMTPTSTSYTLPSELTGCLNDSNCIQHEINPSELNLWRVIRKNADGTIDVVSEYISNKSVSFYGQAGYMNFVGGLNTIALQYTNEKYVQSARHMGYSNQIGKCTSFTTSACPQDTGYTTDINLVKAAIGKINTTVPSGDSGHYFIASRFVSFSPGFRALLANGTIGGWEVKNSVNGSFIIRTSRVRPILTLKSELSIVSGDGNSVDTAYYFE